MGGDRGGQLSLSSTGRYDQPTTATADSKEAFKEAFTSLPLSTEVQGAGAIEALSEVAGRFADAELVGWLLDTAAKLKGDADDRKAAQAAIKDAGGALPVVISGLNPDVASEAAAPHPNSRKSGAAGGAGARTRSGRGRR